MLETKTVEDLNRRKCYIFDIDGTIANLEHRLGLIRPSEVGARKEWEKFYAECVNDNPIEPVVELLQKLLSSGSEILFVTGRSEESRIDTVQWLVSYVANLPWDDYLYMRKDGDHRHDFEIKREIYREKIKPLWDVQIVFEDRRQCVDMWREEGLICFEVADARY